MTTRILKTSSGTFKVTVKDTTTLDFETRTPIIIGKQIGVGGRNICVFLTFPLKGQTARLENVKTVNGGCDVTEKSIRGQDTVNMVHLAFTVLKEIAPHITRIELEDRSDFMCELQNGTHVGISIALYEIAFHRGTWYERHFGAFLQNDYLQKQYEISKQNFFIEKVPEFSFRNVDLDTYLGPIYAETKTWADFFDKVYTLERKCEIMFPWYKEALKQIFGTISYERQDWFIPFETVPKQIEYDDITSQRGGRRRFTQKRRVTPHAEDMLYEDIVSYPYSPNYFRRFHHAH